VAGLSHNGISPRLCKEICQGEEAAPQPRPIFFEYKHYDYTDFKGLPVPIHDRNRHRKSQLTCTLSNRYLNEMVDAAFCIKGPFAIG
jgi:hypothetical protein